MSAFGLSEQLKQDAILEWFSVWRAIAGKWAASLFSGAPSGRASLATFFERLLCAQSNPMTIVGMEPTCFPRERSESIRVKTRQRPHARRERLARKWDARALLPI
jgi:hypothetical protein